MNDASKKQPFVTASAIRLILVTITLLLLFGIIGGFFFANNYLRDFAISGGKTDESPKVDLDRLESELESNKSNISKASSITASPRNYQTKITSDLNYYASNTGISIVRIDLKDPTTKNAMSGISDIRGFEVEISSPVNYENLLKFLKAIDTNLPKIRLNGITISRGENSMVSVQPLSMEVYIKE